MSIENLQRYTSKATKIIKIYNNEGEFTDNENELNKLKRYRFLSVASINPDFRLVHLIYVYYLGSEIDIRWKRNRNFSLNLFVALIDKSSDKFSRRLHNFSSSNACALFVYALGSELDGKNCYRYYFPNVIDVRKWN